MPGVTPHELEMPGEVDCPEKRVSLRKSGTENLRTKMNTKS